MSDRIAEIKARADAIYSTVEFVTIVAATAMEDLSCGPQCGIAGAQP